MKAKQGKVYSSRHGLLNIILNALNSQCPGSDGKNSLEIYRHNVPVRKQGPQISQKHVCVFKSPGENVMVNVIHKGLPKAPFADNDSLGGITAMIDHVTTVA